MKELSFGVAFIGLMAIWLIGWSAFGYGWQTFAMTGAGIAVYLAGGLAGVEAAMKP